MKRTGIIALVGIVACAGTAVYFTKRHKRHKEYNKATKEWMDAISNPCRETDNSESYDLSRQASAIEMIDHYRDITVSYFKDLLYDMNNIPDGTPSISIYIKQKFDEFRERLKVIDDACQTAVKAELSLLSNDYLSNLQPKAEYVSYVLTSCETKYVAMIDSLVIIEHLYTKRAKNGGLSDSESVELQRAINDFVAI